MIITQQQKFYQKTDTIVSLQISWRKKMHSMHIFILSWHSDLHEYCHLLCVHQHGGDEITRVKLVETIDHVLAVGSASGDVCIFQLPAGVHGKSEQVNYNH